MVIKMLLANSLNILKKNQDISKTPMFDFKIGGLLYQRGISEEWQYLPEVFFEDVDVDKWYGDGD